MKQQSLNFLCKGILDLNGMAYWMIKNVIIKEFYFSVLFFNDDIPFICTKKCQRWFGRAEEIFYLST